MIFSVAGTLDKAEKIERGNFVDLNIWERRHVEEWVRTNPEMLGEPLLVLTIEFDQFIGSSDRLDILAVDRNSNLVVIELKRDSAAGYADLQAIRYAAMVSSMRVENAVPIFMAYRKKYYDEQLSPEQARQAITTYFGETDLTEFSTRPRIILCSEGFSREITTTVLWLNTAQLNITCVSITPYKVGDKIVIVPKVIIPLEEAREYQIAIKDKEEQREQASRSRQPRTMRVLFDNGLVQAGEKIYLKNALPSYIQYIDGDPTFEATITGKQGQQNTVLWAKDGAEYSVSALAWKIFKEKHPAQKDPGGLNGSVNWVNASGKSLWDLAQGFLTQSISS